MAARGRWARRLRSALPALLVCAGLVALAWYPASEAWDAWRRAQAALAVDSAAEDASASGEAEYLLAQARAWNAYLAGGTDEEIAEGDLLDYEDQLSLTGHDTAFAYLYIPAIDLTVPVYHGTSDSALSAGAGHLESSSLPVGGESAHAVLAAHSGLAGSRAFDDVGDLEPGDVVGVRVLGEWRCWEVVSTETVLPDEVGSLGIEEGRDLLTLVTCTPYGVNTHRLLVHCERCEVPEGFGEGAASASTALASAWASGRWAPLAAAGALAACALGAPAARRALRRRRAPAPETEAA